MSKKTQNIFKSIDNLQQIQNSISNYNKTAHIRELEDIEFHMGQELKILKFLIESLYSNNGQSTSYAKKQASKENGKKGGRPPKEITDCRKRLAQLEEEIPALQHKIALTDEPAERGSMEKNIEEMQKEKAVITEKLSNWRKI